MSILDIIARNRLAYMNYGLIAYGSLVELEKLQQLISENTRDLKERDEPQRSDFEVEGLDSAAVDRVFHEAHTSWKKKPKLVYQTVASRRLYLGKKKV